MKEVEEKINYSKVFKIPSIVICSKQSVMIMKFHATDEWTGNH